MLDVISSEVHWPFWMTVATHGESKYFCREGNLPGQFSDYVACLLEHCGSCAACACCFPVTR